MICSRTPLLYFRMQGALIGWIIHTIVLQTLGPHLRRVNTIGCGVITYHSIANDSKRGIYNTSDVRWEGDYKLPHPRGVCTVIINPTNRTVCKWHVSLCWQFIIVLFYDFYQLILGLNCYLISSGIKRKALCWILCWREMVLCVAYWRRSVVYFLPYVVIYFPFLFQFVDAEVVCMLLIITTSLYFVWIVLYCLFSLGKLASKGISERKHCKVP